MKRARPGFTLIEIIMAIAIGSMVLVAATVYLFSLSTLYSTVVQAPILNEHADNVAGWLRDVFIRSVDKGPSSRVRWIRSQAVLDGRVMLGFNFTHDGPIPAGQMRPIGMYGSALIFEEDKGLILLSRALQDRHNTGPSAFRFTPLSDQVTSMQFAYYDEKSDTWSFAEGPLKGNLEALPVAVQLTFGDPEKSVSQTRWVMLPIGAPCIAGGAVPPDVPPPEEEESPEKEKEEGEQDDGSAEDDGGAPKG